MVPFKRIINAHGAKLNFTIPKTRATYTTTTTSIITITPTTLITPKHIGIIVEMDSNYPLFLNLETHLFYYKYEKF